MEYNKESFKTALKECKIIRWENLFEKVVKAYLKAEAKQLTLTDVVSSAWYCKISTINGQWFEIVTGKNETEVAIKITEKFGKGTVYNLLDKYELM